MKRLAASCLAAFLFVAGRVAAQDAPAPSLNDLFSRAKGQFTHGAYDASLATLQALDAESRKPEFEASRKTLEPAVAFYRGANLAALGRSAEARTAFEAYLAVSKAPAVRLDPAAYPKAVVELYRSVRGESSRAGEPAEGGLAEEYARFRGAAPGLPLTLDERWADGAIRFLMSKSEKEGWKRIGDPVARAEFVAAFWQRRDPNSQTPENEYREEIERRIQFADKRFLEGETRGGETDRGMIFVLLGPPSYVTERPLRSEDDSVQVARAAPLTELRSNPDGTRNPVSVPRAPMTAERLQGTRQVWYYRRDRLPASVRYPEVDFEFLTKPGYGVAVLQRNPDALAAIDQAVQGHSHPSD
jgi:GWxTD domain-containing protein